jgi:hypothetical protein
VPRKESVKPSEFARIALLVVVAFAAVAPAASAAQPADRPMADVRNAASACETGSLSQVFAPWEDRALYTLAPGGDFETAAEGWTLDGPGTVAADSSPFLLGAALGAGSLELGTGASALSPPICVETGFPTFRFMARSMGDDGDVLTVELVYPDGEAQPVGQVMPGAQLAPTRKVALAQGRLSNPNGSASVQLRFTAPAGTVRVDDVYVDPRYHR